MANARAEIGAIIDRVAPRTARRWSSRGGRPSPPPPPRPRNFPGPAAIPGR